MLCQYSWLICLLKVLLGKHILYTTTNWKWCLRLRLYHNWDKHFCTLPPPLGGGGVKNRSSDCSCFLSLSWLCSLCSFSVVPRSHLGPVVASRTVLLFVLFFSQSLQYWHIICHSTLYYDNCINLCYIIWLYIILLYCRSYCTIIFIYCISVFDYIYIYIYIVVCVFVQSL